MSDATPSRDRGGAGGPAIRAGGWLVFLAVGAGLMAGAWFVSTGPYSTDEAVYILMADAARAGRLTIDNGYEAFASDFLKISFLREGRAGLVPQYPAGFGFVALPFYAVAGVRGLILLNLAAHLATLVLTCLLAFRISLRRRWALAAAAIYGFGTFSLSYAYGIWPHALATLFVLGSVVPLVMADEERGARPAWVWMLASGLVLGLGTTIRVDVILLAPGVALWLLTGKARWVRLASYAAGMAPGLLLAGWLNFLKFGTWAPISYGVGGSGNLSPAGYLPLAAAFVLAIVAVLVVTSRWVTPLVSGRRLVLALAAAIAVMLLIDEARLLAARALAGLYPLVVDFQTYQPRPWEAAAFSNTPDGHLLLAGQLKRALLQSLPWLGVLPGLWLVWSRRPELRPVIRLFGLVIAIWMLPFALKAWHGGSPQNMRYFLPILPLLSILAALTLDAIHKRAAASRAVGRRPVLATVFVAWLLTSFVFLGVIRRHAMALDAATTGALLLAAVTVLAALAALPDWKRVRTAAGLSFLLTIAGLVWAGTSAVFNDLLVSQGARRVNQGVAEAALEIVERPALVLTRTPYRFISLLLEPGTYVGSAVGTPHRDGRALIDFHLNAGRAVYVDRLLLEGPRSGIDLEGLERSVVPVGAVELIQVRPGQGQRR